MSETKSISYHLADYAAVSGKRAAYISDHHRFNEEQQMMNRLLEIHAGLVIYAVQQTG